jgi:hypothetical protein
MTGRARTILAGLAPAWLTLTWLASASLVATPAAAELRSDPANTPPANTPPVNNAPANNPPASAGPQLHRILYSGRGRDTKISGEIVLQADGTWVETNQARNFTFQEVSRTETTLMLNDARRHLNLRIELAEHRIYWSTGERWNALYQIDAVE